MKPTLSKTSQLVLYALVTLSSFWGISSAVAAGDDSSSMAAARAIPAEINGEGTIVGPNGGQPEFDIIDLENEHVTKKFLEGEFAYSDRKSHVVFVTANIKTVTVSGNTAAFTGTARLGGKHRRKVTFAVDVTANQDPITGDTFSIALSNGYNASGNLTRGFISIDVRE